VGTVVVGQGRRGGREGESYPPGKREEEQRWGGREKVEEGGSSGDCPPRCVHFN